MTLHETGCRLYAGMLNMKAFLLNDNLSSANMPSTVLSVRILPSSDRAKRRDDQNRTAFWTDTTVQYSSCGFHH